jgi:hypothetical protein
VEEERVDQPAGMAMAIGHLLEIPPTKEDETTATPGDSTRQAEDPLERLSMGSPFVGYRRRSYQPDAGEDRGVYHHLLADP